MMQQQQQQQEPDGEEALGPVKPMKDLSIAEGQKVHIALKVQLPYIYPTSFMRSFFPASAIISSMSAR